MERVFRGSEALAAGQLDRYAMRTRYRRVLPDVYASKRAQLSLMDRTKATWLWTGRDGVLAGLAASALHGALWVDSDVEIEVNWPNHKPPPGVVVRNETLHADEVQRIAGMRVTSVERTAFDLARRGPLGPTVARIDSLARATDVKISDVLALKPRHPHLRGIRRVDKVLDLVDAGAESPRETWLRLLLIEAGFPRPQTQIPVLSPTGYPRYRLDTGWPDLKVAVEYDGEHHRTDRPSYTKDIVRLEYIQSVGWIVIRVVAGMRRYEIIDRVGRARRLRLL